MTKCATGDQCVKCGYPHLVLVPGDENMTGEVWCPKCEAEFEVDWEREFPAESAGDVDHTLLWLLLLAACVSMAMLLLWAIC